MYTKSEIRNFIAETIMDILSRNEGNLLIDLTDDAVLLETGMDSLGFAILVAELEDKLGYDPFTIMDEPVYPTTFGEFVSIYKKYS